MISLKNFPLCHREHMHEISSGVFHTTSSLFINAFFNTDVFQLDLPLFFYEICSTFPEPSPWFVSVIVVDDRLYKWLVEGPIPIPLLPPLIPFVGASSKLSPTIKSTLSELFAELLPHCLEFLFDGMHHCLEFLFDGMQTSIVFWLAALCNGQSSSTLGSFYTSFHAFSFASCLHHFP